MSEILEKLGLYGVPLAILLGWFAYQFNSLVHPINSAFPRRIESLRDRDYPSAYQRYLSCFLIWLEKYFGACEPPNTPTLKSYVVAALTGRSHEVILFIAVIYPIIFLVLGWHLASNRFDLFGLFEFSQRLRPGDVAVVNICGAIAVIVLFGGRGVVAAIVAAIVIATGIIYALSLGFDFVDLGAIVGAVVVAVTVVLRGVVASTDRGALAIVFACAIGLSVAVAGSVDGLTAFLVGFCIALVFSSEGTFALVHVKNQITSYFFLLLYTALCIWMATSFGDNVNADVLSARALILFLCVIPLFNSPLDWLSLGFTRGLLHFLSERKISAATLLLFGLSDAIIAIFFLFAVAANTVLGIWFMDAVAVHAGGKPMVDLDGLLAQMQQGEWERNLWILMLLCSTLIPTAIHFTTAMLALAFLKSHEKADEMANLLQADRDRAVVARKKGGTQEGAAVTSDMDARLFAFVHIYVYPLILGAFSLAVVLVVGLFFLSFLPSWMSFVLSILG